MARDHEQHATADGGHSIPPKVRTPTNPNQRPADQPRQPSADDRSQRHGDPRSTTRRQPWSVLGPPETVPMDTEQYQAAVRAWAVLIASWWSNNPPDHAQDGDHV